MAGFNLTAEINLRGPSNLKKVVGDIKRQLSGIQTDVNLKISDKAAKSLDSITSSVNALNNALARAQTSANGLTSVLSTVGSSGGNTAQKLNSVSQSVTQVVSSTASASKVVAQASSEMAEFGKQSALAVRRFAAFSVATGAIYGLARAFTSAYSEFVQFDRELVRLKQTVGGFGQDIDSISSEISRLSTTFGVSSSDLLKVSVTLAQAGLSARETKNALEALAKTTLSPSFEDITQTTEGAIAALRQFGLQTKDLESSLGSINAVAAAFAVESSDIISAIQRTGGVFASASKGVSQGKDALNEFIAVFTSVRQTTRESAETIATGLRTIFTRIQRGSTIEALREYGIELTDLKGKFVGGYEAVKRLSEGLAGLDTRDIRFSKIVEELGGFRQIGKVIPLIKEFAVTQQALGIAQQGQASLTTNAIQAQQALAVQFSKTREEFLSFVRALGQSDTFQNLVSYGLSFTRVLIQIASAFKPLMPYLATLGALKGGAALTEYVGGFVGGLKKGSGSKTSASQDDLLGSLFSSAKEKSSADSSTTGRLESLISENSTALSNVNNALVVLNRTLSSKTGPTTLNSGGRVMAFASGGVVPGSGNRDTVPAMLMPGEFVIRKKAVETLGAGNLHRMNKYASGGKVKDLTATKPDLTRYYDTENDKDTYSQINIDRPTEQTSFRQSREKYRERAEKIWQQASSIFAQSKDLQEANTYIRRKTRIDPGSYDSKELDPANTSPQRFNRIQGALAEQTVRGQTRGLNKLPNSAGADFSYADSNGTKFIEVKNRLEKTDDSDLISKALLGYAYINGVSPEFFKNNKLDEISGLNIELRSTNPLDIQSKNFGGIIQKFMAGGAVGSVGGIEPSLLSRFDVEKLEPTNSSDVEELIALIELMGGNEKTRNLANIQSVNIGGRQVRSGDVLSANKLRASKNAAYIPYARDIVNAAIEQYNANLESQAGFQQAMLSANQFQMATLLPFDANKTIQAMIGGKATSIIAKGIPSENIDIIQELQSKLSSATSEAAEKIQMRKIFGSTPLVFDFDETLIENMSNLMNFPNGGVNTELFSDLPRVEKALESIKLTRLGEVLKAKLDNQEISPNDLRIVSARPQSNAPYMAKALARLGLNIPESRITGTTGAENKIHNVSEFETLIDDRLATVEQFQKAGKKAIGYAPIVSDFEGVKAVFAGQAAMEGAAAEKILANLGAPLRADAEPGRPIDYPQGLGLSAQYWGLDPNIPTEVKRELNSSAITRTKAEILRFYNKNAEGYKVGGEVKQSDIYLQKYKQLISSILPKEMISDEGLLKTPSGRSESIDIIPPEDLGEKSKRSMMDILLGRAPSMPQQQGGASYSGGLIYKLIRQNLYDAKDSIPEKEFLALKNFVDQNLLFEGENDIINLEQQKRRGSLAHESFHDIQGYLLDYYPEIYKKLQQSVNNQRKRIAEWYADPHTEQWRTSRDYKLQHLFPQTASDSPYSNKVLEAAKESTKKSTGQRFLSNSFWGEIYAKTMMDLGRQEAIPVLMAAAAENNQFAQRILSDIFSSAGLNKDFYKYMPKFAAGGKADPFDDVRGYGQLTGGLAGLISGLYGEPGSITRQFQGAGITQGFDPDEIRGMPGGLHKSSQAKEYNKISLTEDGNMISAGYLKNDSHSGYVNAYKMKDYLYYVGLSKATSGYGPRLYDVVMEAVSSKGAMLTSDRNSVSGDAKKVWEYYFKNRGDVKKTPLDPEDWTRNQAYIDPKLYGRKETWPPATDPAWVLQTGYSKSPSLINDPNAVKRTDQKQNSQQMAMEYFSSRTPRFAKGGTAQDTVPALLTPGEFVINKKAAQRIGYGKLHQLNKADKLQGFNKGGFVGFAAGGKAAPGNYAAEVDNFVAQLVKLTQTIEATTYKMERASGKSVPEAKKQADTMAQLGVIDAGRATVYLNPESAQAVGDAVGKVLESYVTKLNPLIEGGPRRTGYATAGGPISGFASFIEDTTPKQDTVEKWKLLAAAAGDSLDIFSDRVKRFTVDLAVNYKNLISRTQTRAKAAVALASNQPANEGNRGAAVELLRGLLQNYQPSAADKGKFTPEAVERTLENAAKLMEQGLSFDQVKKSSDLLQIAFDNVIENSEALAVALSEAEKRFGPLTERQTASETLMRGIESGRWSGSLSRVESMQASSEANPFWEKIAGNKFPGFDAINAKSPALAESLGKITEKFGGFIGVLSTGMAVLGNSLPKVYEGFDKLAGTSLKNSETAQGFGQALNQAGNDALGMAKFAQQAEFGAKGTGIAAGVGLTLGAVKGFAEGFITQKLENTNARIADSQEKISNLLSQLSTPGLEPAAQEDIKADALKEIQTLTNELGSVLKNTESYWSTSVYNLADAALFAAQTFLTVASTLALIRLGSGLTGSTGGYIGYYSSGNLVKNKPMFQPKGTDTVPAMLTPGEFVVNAGATKRNRGLLEDINSGRYMARGGVVYAAQGSWIQSDKEAGRYSGNTYVGTLSDYYNPFDEDFYKESARAEYAIYKWTGRIAGLVAIIAGATAAVMTFAPAIGAFFTETLPGLFTAGFAKVSTFVAGAWAKIAGIFGATKTAAVTTAAGVPVVAPQTAAAAGGGGIMGTLATGAKLAFGITALTSTISFLYRWLSGSGQNKEQQQNLVLQGQIIDKLIEYAKLAEVQSINLQELKNIMTEAKGLTGNERLRFFAERSPVVSAAQRAQLQSSGFGIGEKQSIDDFISGLDAANQEQARVIIDSVKLEQIRKSIVADEAKKASLAGKNQEEAAAQIAKVVAPLENLTTFSEAQQQGVNDPAIRQLLERGQVLQGPTAQKILFEELFARMATKMNAQVDMVVIALKNFEQGINRVGDLMTNLQNTLPTALGNRLGSDTPAVRLDRSDLAILKNVSSSSSQQIAQAVATGGAQMGMTSEGTRYFTQQFGVQKVLETELPLILSRIVAETKTGGEPNEPTASEKLQTALEAAISRVVPDKDTAKVITTGIVSKLNADNRGQGGYERFIQDPALLASVTKQQNASASAFIRSLETIKSSIENLTQISDAYANVITKVTELQGNYARISAESAVNLKRALGEEVSLPDLNKIFDDEIKAMTQGTRGFGTTDPREIGRRLAGLEAERQSILDELEMKGGSDLRTRVERGMTLPQFLQPQFAALGKRLGVVTSESDRLQKALQTLASNSQNAANVLAKIQELRRIDQAKETNFMDFLKNINNPEYIMELQQTARALSAVMSGQGTRFDIPQAIKGLEMRVSQMSPEDADKERKAFLDQILKIEPALAQLFGPGGAFEGAFKTKNPQVDALQKQYDELVARQLAAVGELQKRAIEGGDIVLNRMKQGAEIWYTAVMETAKFEATVRQQNIDRAKEAELERKRQEESRALGLPALGAPAGGGGGAGLPAPAGATSSVVRGIPQQVALSDILIDPSKPMRPIPVDIISISDPTLQRANPVANLNASTGGKIVYAAGGDYINFQPKGTDTIPAMLTPGEFVVNKKATQKNLGLLKSINSGYYANGGLVTAQKPILGAIMSLETTGDMNQDTIDKVIRYFGGEDMRTWEDLMQPTAPTRQSRIDHYTRDRLTGNSKLHGPGGEIDPKDERDYREKVAAYQSRFGNKSQIMTREFHDSMSIGTDPMPSQRTITKPSVRERSKYADPGEYVTSISKYADKEAELQTIGGPNSNIMEKLYARTIPDARALKILNEDGYTLHNSFRYTALNDIAEDPSDIYLSYVSDAASIVQRAVIDYDSIMMDIRKRYDPQSIKPLFGTSVLFGSEFRAPTVKQTPPNNIPVHGGIPRDYRTPILTSGPTTGAMGTFDQQLPTFGIGKKEKRPLTRSEEETGSFMVLQSNLSKINPIDFNTKGKAERADAVSYLEFQANMFKRVKFPPLDDKLGESSISRIYNEALNNELDIDDFYKAFVLPKANRDWEYTEGRDWLEYFGIPSDSEGAMSLLYGVGSKIIPAICSTVAAGVGFAVGTPLGPIGSILFGGAAGVAGNKLGEWINEGLYKVLVPDFVKKDIERKSELYPREFATGQWIGFASELAAGIKYGPVIEQFTKQAIAKNAAKLGFSKTAAAYGMPSEIELALAGNRLKQQAELAIKEGQINSTPVIHGTPKIGWAMDAVETSAIDPNALKLTEMIDPKITRTSRYGPGGDMASEARISSTGKGAGGMIGFNVNKANTVGIRDAIGYATEDIEAVSRKILSGKANYKQLKDAMDNAGFIMSDVSTAMMDDGLVRMMDNVSADDELFKKILDYCEQTGQADLLKKLHKGVGDRWYKALNRLRDSMVTEYQFFDVAPELGIKGTRASILDIRGGSTIPPGTGTINNESIALLTNKVLGESTALKLNDLMKFRASFIENAKQFGVIIDESGKVVAIEGTKTHDHNDDIQHHKYGGLIYASNGSYINFKPKGTDTVPAMLTPGEFVVNRKATQNNLPLLQSINNGYYNKGGKVKYLANGGSSGNADMAITNGVSSISIDTSSLDSAFTAFGNHVGNMKQSLDSFSSSISGLANLGEGARTLSVAAASIRNASDNFGSNIRLFSATLSSLERSINNIPSSISLQVTGSIPVNVNVQINGGKDLDNSLQPFKDTIYSEITKAISDATQGNININLLTTKR